MQSERRAALQHIAGAHMPPEIAHTILWAASSTAPRHACRRPTTLKPLLSCRFKHLVVSDFGDVFDFATVKFRQLDEFAACAKQLASAVYTDTATNERTHKDIKPFDAFNNNQEGATGQVGHGNTEHWPAHCSNLQTGLLGQVQQFCRSHVAHVHMPLTARSWPGLAAKGMLVAASQPAVLACPGWPGLSGCCPPQAPQAHAAGWQPCKACTGLHAHTCRRAVLPFV